MPWAAQEDAARAQMCCTSVCTCNPESNIDGQLSDAIMNRALKPKIDARVIKVCVAAFVSKLIAVIRRRKHRHYTATGLDLIPFVLNLMRPLQASTTHQDESPAGNVGTSCPILRAPALQLTTSISSPLSSRKRAATSGPNATPTPRFDGPLPFIFCGSDQSISDISPASGGSQKRSIFRRSSNFTCVYEQG